MLKSEKGWYMRKSLVVGNWKMNGSLASNKALVKSLIATVGVDSAVDVSICVPAIYIAQVSSLLTNQAISYGAQDVSIHEEGAYTGEISVGMLSDLGCSHVIVGHSERRQYHNENSELVARKALVAQQAGLTPIICVGETQEQRQSGNTLTVIQEQVAAITSLLSEQDLKAAVIAYEPVWAIGTGLTATPEQAQEVHQFIREQLGSAGGSTRVLYGGSVKADTAVALFLQPDIDGALVGGAALDATEFSAIISAAG